jgi:hypothetical protein
MNSARALVALADVPGKARLVIIVDDGEPAANVPPSLEDEGYRVFARERRGGQWILTVGRA